MSIKMPSLPTFNELVPQDSAAAEFFLRIEPRKGLFSLDLGEVWAFRELLYFLVWRDVSVRYKQTIIGMAWAILQPVLTMLIFTLVFGHFAGIPSDGLPYSIFVFASLLPWNCFSQAISRSGVSLVNDSNLVKKVYFPRLIIPLAGVASPLVDFFVSFLALLVMMAWYGIALRWSAITLPLFTLLGLLCAFAAGVWLAPLNAKYRDVGHAIPFLTQFLMFASPVTYPLSIIPHKWRLIYGLNPLVGVIEGFRWALLGKTSPDFGVIGLSVLIVLGMLMSGIVFFKRMERSFSDVL
jgi:lipopolysaccharide transport system permease protein